jgi:hypothetical protein
MNSRDTMLTMLNVEQLDLFSQKLNIGHKNASILFDDFQIWDFIDDAFEGLHVQGPLATYEDIREYLKNRGRII